MFRLFRVELARVLALNLRYPTNFISSLLINTMMFYGLFKGAQYLSGQQVFGERLDTMVLGYAAWVLVTKAINRTPIAIQEDADTGVLESLFLSAYRKDILFLTRALAGAVIDVVTVVAIVFLLVLFTGSSIAFSAWVLLPVATLVLSAIGLGLVLGAFALQVKRVNAILPSVQLLALGLMFTPFEELSRTWPEMASQLYLGLPMVPSVVLLRELMVQQVVNPQSMLMAIANAISYVLMGMLFFSLMTRRARSKGLLGGH